MINDKEFLHFHENFYKPYFEKYIEFKRGKGEKVAHSTLIRLKILNNTLNTKSYAEITQAISEALLQPRPKEKPQSRQLRISDLRQFCKFLSIQGINAYQVPQKYMKCPCPKFRPYIFTDSELNKITLAADNLPYGQRSHHHQKIYPILIRILIGTGMRISEVLALNCCDIDLSNGVIKVINSKNGLSRYIPVSESLLNALKVYTRQPVDHVGYDDPFFKSPYTGEHYTYDAMKYMFPKICMSADVYTLEGSTPNIHSLRHTFCTKSLDQMLSTGMNPYTALPILSAYVGHVNLTDTEKYIHLTRNNHEHFIQSESSLSTIIPEVI